MLCLIWPSLHRYGKNLLLNHSCTVVEMADSRPISLPKSVVKVCVNRAVVRCDSRSNYVLSCLAYGSSAEGRLVTRRQSATAAISRNHCSRTGLIQPWRIIHVLMANCPCSGRVATWLRQRQLGQQVLGMARMHRARKESLPVTCRSCHHR